MICNVRKKKVPTVSYNSVVYPQARILDLYDSVRGWLMAHVDVSAKCCSSIHVSISNLLPTEQRNWRLFPGRLMMLW